ncbi:hypothetical protein DMC63_28615 [Streptomyces sp. WAC 05977]|nr:hypothetical protein DMC63_28615 [Streptomyces sp. WAC 05977]
MRYLTRALPPRTEAYAFSQTGKEEGWRQLGITPVTYPPKDNHRALPEAINAWVRRVNATPIEKQNRISSIAKTEPPLSPIDGTYVDWALSIPETLRYFLNVAKPHVWSRWLSDNGFFSALMAATHDDCAPLWSSWLAESIKTEHGDILLDLLQESSTSPNSLIWWDIWRILSKDYSSVHSARKYLTILLANASAVHDNAERLSSMLPELISVDRDAAIHAFEFLTQTKTEVSNRFSFLGNDWPLQIEVRPLGDPYWLHQAWGMLRQKLEDDTNRLLQLAISRINTSVSAYMLFEDGLEDDISRKRDSIDDEANDEEPAGGLNIIIDIARDLLRESAKQNPKGTLHQINWMLDQKHKILQRLAIDALGHDTTYNPKVSLGIILTRRLLFSYDLMPEVFNLLKIKYHAADSATANKVIHQAQTSRPGRHDAQLNRYARYNLLLWLKTCAPAHRPTADAFDQIQKANPNFSPREHPNLHSWIKVGDWHEDDYQPTGQLRGMSAVDIIGTVPASGLSNAAEKATRNWIRELLLACNDEPPEFVRDVLREFSLVNTWNVNVWSSLLNLLTEKGGATNTTGVLDLVASHPHSGMLAGDIRRLLEKYWSTLDVSLGTAEKIKEQLKFVFMLWLAAADDNSLYPEKSGPTLEWAINEPRGNLALAYMNGLIKYANSSKDSQISSNHFSALEIMLETSESPSDPTSVIVSSQPSWLLTLDRDWCISRLMPLFQWVSNQKVSASKSWEGFLHWGRWSPDLIDLLAEEVRTSLTSIRSLLPNSVERFVHHHAAVFMFPLGTREEHWPDVLISSANTKELLQWNDSLVQRLNTEDSTAQSELWVKFSNYWRRRIRGLPIQLKPEEVSSLAKCLTIEGVQAKDVVQLLLDSPVPTASRFGSTRSKIIENLPVEDDADSSATIMARLLEAESHVTYRLSMLISTSRRLFELKANGALLVVQQLIRLGVPGAIDLAREFTKPASDT